MRAWLRDLFERKSVAPSHPPARARLALESLERRDVMSITFESVYGARVDITGTAGDDVVSLRYAGANDSLLAVTLNGRTQTFDRSAVSSVTFAGGAGDDQFTNSTGVYAIVDGGAGNDTLSGGDGGNQLMGGPGKDHIYGGRATDSLIGGDDDDVIYGNPPSDEAAALDGDLGLYSTGEQYLNWGGRNEKWVMAGTGWHFITPDGSLYKWDSSGAASGQLVGRPGPWCYADLTRLTEAYSAPLTYQLDVTLGLYSTGEQYLNWGGRNEKWVMAGTGWHFITPDGSLYKWDSSGGASGTLVAKLDGSYYADTGRLVNATAPPVAGTGGGDLIVGNDGADRLFGSPWDDLLDGGSGDDTLDGGAGVDTLYLGPANNPGNNTVIDPTGNDVVE